jgi:hypothetical protein
MYATATQPKIEHIHHQPPAVREPRETAPSPAARFITATFMEQHGAGRLEELAETLDFPLDFQI